MAALSRQQVWFVNLPACGAASRRYSPGARMRLVRHIIAGLVAAALLGGALLANWGGFSGGGQEQVTIRFWNVFTGPDGRTMLRLVKQFNRENPDVRVVMQRLDATGGLYYNKLFVAGLGGRSPEVFVAHSDVLPRFQRARMLRPLDDLIARGGLDAGDFDPNVWQYCQYDGRTMAIPLDIHPLGLYYNERLFEEAGIVDESGAPRPPRDRAEFVDALRKIKAKGKWGLTFTWLRTNVYAVMCQFGGRMFTDDLSRCTLDDPANVEALEFCVELIRQGLIASPQNMDSWIGFRQGKVGMVFEGIYMLQDLKRVGDLPYAGAPMPQLGTRRATWANSHSLCIRADLSGRELQAAWRLIRFLSDHSLDWAEGGQVPVRRSLRQTARFASMPIQSRFAEQLPYVRYLPRIPFLLEFQSEYDLAVERALRQSQTPKEALAEAARRMNAVLARDRQMYGGRP